MNEVLETTFDERGLLLTQEHVRQLLTCMGFTTAVVTCRYRDERLYIDIDAGDEGKLLIGVRGTHLAALQHIIHCVLRQQLGQHIHTRIDVNGYQSRRERDLLEMAETAAKQVQTTGRTIVLKAMGPADRRMIHTGLSTRTDVSTASIGAEPNRKVVIKPVFV
jgi:spoIIIJ-associated protein